MRNLPGRSGSLGAGPSRRAATLGAWSLLAVWALSALPALAAARDLPAERLLGFFHEAASPCNATIYLRGEGAQQQLLLFLDKGALRLETGATVTIERRDLGRLWVLDKTARTFLDAPLLPSQLPDPGEARRSIRIVHEGDETLDGKPVWRFAATMPVRFLTAMLTQHLGPQPEDDAETVTVWWRPDLGLVVKRLGPGESSLELKDIQLGPQSPSRFEIPDGYRLATPASK